MLRFPSPGEPALPLQEEEEDYGGMAPPSAARRAWQLECWGRGWAWAGCRGSSEGWGNVSLVPLRRRAVGVTWSWPQRAPGEALDAPTDGLRYQVEYGTLDAPFMLGRVGGNSRGVTLEEGVQPWTTYEVKLTTDAMANASAIFFQIKETVLETGTSFVRAEEITLVLLVLALWAVAILLFFHRWGKIRMLEPYQPEYKPLNHSPACPLAPATPTQTQPRPTNNPKPLLPRKSSSLCFTPSMLRSVHVPPACRISVPQIDQTPVHRWSRPPAAHQSPAAHAHHTRHRLRLASDSLDHGGPQPQVDASRKVRSAENLRNYRITPSRGYSEDSGIRGAAALQQQHHHHHHHHHQQHQQHHHQHQHPLARRRSCQSQSLDLDTCRSGTPFLLHEAAVPRGRSLDSTSVGSLRRSPTAGPSWASGGGGDPPPTCTTPELRVSPTPPEAAAASASATAASASHAVALQRQEATIDDALLPVPYATLMEEEMENEV